MQGHILTVLNSVLHSNYNTETFYWSFTNASLLVILLPAFFALITVLIGCSGAGFAGGVALCRTKGKPEIRIMPLTPFFPCVSRKVSDASQKKKQLVGLQQPLVEEYLCTEKRCCSSLRWSSHQCSPGKNPLYNRGHSCTFRSLHESRRHHTSRFHDKVCQSPPHRLQKVKSETQHKHRNI